MAMFSAALLMAYVVCESISVSTMKSGSPMPVERTTTFFMLPALIRGMNVAKRNVEPITLTRNSSSISASKAAGFRSALVVIRRVSRGNTRERVDRGKGKKKLEKI